jgi:hypothetical protein
MSHNQVKGKCNKYTHYIIYNLGLGKRDDLESLMYTLIYILKGDLPWSMQIDYSFG